MVGHTGDLKASIHACAIVDKCLKDLLEVCNEVGGRFLVTSDHGNSDDMVQREKKTNKPLYDADSGGFTGVKGGELWGLSVCGAVADGCVCCDQGSRMM
jgi:hypothetical protein